MSDLTSTYPCSQNYERLWHFILDSKDKEIIVFNQTPSGLYSFGILYHGNFDGTLVLHWGERLFSYGNISNYTNRGDFDSFIKDLTELKAYFIVA